MKKTPIDHLIESVAFAQQLADMHLYWLLVCYWRLVLMPRLVQAYRYIIGEE